MSKVNVNTIEPSTGTDITLGASGDTITVPSGATFTQSGTMNASAITAGTMATARLGSGTASSSTVLYGDQTYKAEPTGGKILQVIYQNITADTAVATTTYTDFFTQAITPATNSDVLISCNLQSYHTQDDRGYGIKILRGASAIYTSATQYALNLYQVAALELRQKSSFYFVDTTPGGDGSTAITYKIQVGTNGGRSVTFSNNNNSSELILMEIGA